MLNYFGSKCPVCGETFKENDDIVVCPECGSPHHRDCYKKLNKCANEAKHGEYEWAPDSQIPSQKHDTNVFVESSESVKCPNCGTENNKSNKYCSYCGTPLGLNNNWPGNIIRDFSKQFESVDYNGVSAAEITEAVGKNSSFYFLNRFKYFTEGHKISPNFFAFLFSYFYLFYRKMYNLGITIFIIISILGIPGMLLDLQTLQELYVEQGILSQIIYEIPHQEILNTYAIIGNILIWIIRIGLLLFFNYFYYFKITATIKGIKAGLNEAGLNDEQHFKKYLHKKCGTSMFIPVLFIILTLAISIALAVYICLSPYFIMTL